jgi:alkylhydroperoxidase family enzyme
MFCRLLWIFSFTFLLPGALAAAEPPRLPLLSNDQAWRRLNGKPEEEQPLPSWARMLAGPLPFATARMLDLDALHRTGDRLDARLRCLARWAAADANGCAYSKAVAVADYRRATSSQLDLEAIARDTERLCALDKAALSFARKMMREAYAVTDGEVKQLLDLAGEERLVALVALVAHASFHDRLILALNVDAGADSSLPPIMAHFGAPNPTAGGRPSTSPHPAPAVEKREQAPAFRTNWLALRDGLLSQHERPGRIRVPSPEELIARIGPNHSGAWQKDINWSRVCFGFQPELTEAWFDCANAFRQEAQLDRVFQNCIFWLVTKSVQCFY